MIRKRHSLRAATDTLIGEVPLGEVAFRNIMNDERLAHIPKVIEPEADATATDARMWQLRAYTATQ